MGNCRRWTRPLGCSNSRLHRTHYICPISGPPAVPRYRIMGRIGPTEIILIIALILLLFGGKKIPELMRGLGKGMKEFKDAQKDDPGSPEKP